MAQSDILTYFDGYWKVVCAKVRRPLSGVVVPDEIVVREARQVFDEFLGSYDDLPPRGEAGKFLTQRALRRGLEAVATARQETGDLELYHDPEISFYERNLDLAELQKRSDDGSFNAAEWGGLPDVLRGRAMAVLRRCGVQDADSEDVFNDCLAVLAKQREQDKLAPIEKLTIFEEVFPLFTTIVHNRGVSWLRKQSAQKNRPNNPAYGESLDDPDKHLAPVSADSGDDPWEGVTFDRMFDICHECLTELEWHILTALFVEANVTRGDLAEDPKVMQMMGVKESSSLGNRRRHLNKHMESALEKLGKCLKTKDL